MLFSMDPLTLAILSSSILSYPHPQNTKDLHGPLHVPFEKRHSSSILFYRGRGKELNSLDIV